MSAELMERLRLVSTRQLELLIAYRQACEERGEAAGLELAATWPPADQEELASAGRILAGEEPGELAACYAQQPAAGLGLARPATAKN